MAETDFIKITEEVVSVFGKNLIEDIKKRLRTRNKYATGKLIQSLDFRLQVFAEQYVLEFFGESYLQNVELGRKPGTYPPIQAIRMWMSAKGISGRGVEYAIQKSIYKFGIKPTPTISEAIDTNSLTQYSSKMASDYVTGLERYAQQTIQDAINTSKKK